jgi:hypothetical protein
MPLEREAMEKSNRSTFSLRFRKENLREMIKDLAMREGISQNELLEQAAEHEVIVRGALVADDLEYVASQMRRLSAKAYSALVEESLVAAAGAEGVPDPLRDRQISRYPDLAGLAIQQFAESMGIGPQDHRDSVGAIAAFENFL